MTAQASQSTRFVLVREGAGRFRNGFSRLWRKRWIKALVILALLPVLAILLAWILFARDLPSAESLLTYQPPLPSNVRSIDGEPIQSFARERRVELAYEEYPRQLIEAYLSAEDKTFFSHGGLDYQAFAAAVFNYATSLGSGERVAGGSTITQQVAKNLLLGNDYSVTRKIKEAFLARRIEDVLSKEQILELYLNQIFLGRNAYGVQSAARAYFDKDVDQLQLHESAYLAILPKAPSNYTPERHEQRALARRNYVLAEMEANNFITPAQRAAGGCAAARHRSRRQEHGEECRRLLYGRGPPPARRPLWREDGERAARRLYRRLVGAHLLSAGDAEGGRGCAARRPAALRRRSLVARFRAQDRYVRRLADAARHRRLRRRL
jgi:penicillin-binding protein 1A